MPREFAPKDLIVLVADKNMEFGLRGLLSRPEALGIRKLAGLYKLSDPDRAAADVSIPIHPAID